MERRERNRRERVVDTLIGLIAGIFIGTNFGFVIAGLMGRADNGKDMPDK